VHNQIRSAGRALRYDTATYELLPASESRNRPWCAADVRTEISRRAAIATAATELVVDYYRIGYLLAFPLPLNERPTDYPAPIPGISEYPWPIWLAWELEKRWYVLDNARRLGDAAAGATLRKELDALAGWASFDFRDSGSRLAGATFAGCLAELRESDELDAGRRLLAENPVGDEPAPAGPLHNIPLITLIRMAQLAEIVGDPAADRVRDRAVEAFRIWLAARSHGYSEGAGYDGYVLYHACAWIDGSANSRELRESARAELTATMRSWADLALPGRIDVLAPLGDTEPEMPFWAAAMIRMARWYGDAEMAAWIRHFPLDRLPASVLEAAEQLGGFEDAEFPVRPGPHRQPATVTLRDGDLAVAISAANAETGHLHHDAGHLVLGWAGRFWITDPGYQQYRAGIEREFTLGVEAHNAPVIDGAGQTKRRCAVRIDGDDHVVLDLGACYDEAVDIRREIWLRGATVVVRDEIRGVPDTALVHTHWLGGTGLAWSFRAGCARLSDGARAVWIATAPGGLDAGALGRHPGSRGQLTLRAAARGQHVRWWSFTIDPAGGWSPPQQGFPTTQ
jgi:hypothetical protein